VYERSFLLDGHYGDSTTFTEAMKVDGGDGRATGNGIYTKTAGANKGAVYVVCGSSARADGGSLDHPAMFIGMNRLGSVVIDIDGGRLDLKFLRETGAIDDWFTIAKD
jgi:hypothetical protein